MRVRPGDGVGALVIIGNIHFALIGGIFAWLIPEIPLPVSAAIGFLARFGPTVFNGVVMLAYFNWLKLQDMDGGPSVCHGVLPRRHMVLH